MARRKFHVGDKVTVTAYTAPSYAPGVKDELGTEDLFRSMVGKVYTVRGYDKWGHIRLQPRRSDTVWIDSKDLKLRARRKSKAK